MSDAFADFTDKYGLIHGRKVGPDRAPASLNGNLYTSERYILKWLWQLRANQTSFDLDTGLAEIAAEWRAAVLSTEDHSGLFDRAPGQSDQNAQDDYWGLVTASCLLDHGELAWEILSYGRAHGFIWDNVGDGQFRISSWLGRHLDLPVHMAICAGDAPGIFGDLIWAASLIARAHTTDQDGLIRGWLQVQAQEVAIAGSVPRDLAVLYFKRRFRQRGLSMRKIVGDYLGNAEHPLAILWDDFL